MQANSKFQTFIGFAVRANKYKAGMNSILTLKRAKLVIVCKSASENTKKQALKVAKKLGAELYVTVKSLLADLIYKENAKVMAITDGELSKAVLNNADGELLKINQENIYG